MSMSKPLEKTIDETAILALQEEVRFLRRTIEALLNKNERIVYVQQPYLLNQPWVITNSPINWSGATNSNTTGDVMFVVPDNFKLKFE